MVGVYTNVVIITTNLIITVKHVIIHVRLVLVIQFLIVIANHHIIQDLSIIFCNIYVFVQAHALLIIMLTHRINANDVIINVIHVLEVIKTNAHHVPE